LQQLIRIAANRGNGRSGLQFDADVLAEKIKTPELRRTGDDGVDVDQGTCSLGTWRAKLSKLFTSVFVRRAWSRIFSAR